MILVIDAGNSRIKWGLWQTGGWVQRDAAPILETDRVADVLAAVNPEWIGVSCVAGGAVRVVLQDMLAQHPRPFWLKPAREAYGVYNGYAQPETLGVDRFANLIACRALGLGPCLVVSVGTAVTVDALTADGVFRGGLILPGAGLMRKSLHQATAGVHPVPGRLHEYPDCTADAVESGVAAAISGAIAQFRERFEADVGHPVEVVLTGGDAAWIATRVASPQRQIPDLVLEGLVWVARGQGVQGI